MVKYYQTGSGLCYKEYADGRKVRVSRGEFLTGGAKKKSPTATTSPKKSASKAKSPKFSAAEQACIDKAQAIITKNKELPKGTYPHIAALVASSYEEAYLQHPECVDFYGKEKERKAALKATRKKSRKSRKGRKSRSKSRKGAKKRSKSRSKKASKSKSKSK